MVVSLPVLHQLLLQHFTREIDSIHLVVEDLGFPGLGLWDERLVENPEDILTDVLQFGLDLLTVVTDNADVLIRAL